MDSLWITFAPADAHTAAAAPLSALCLRLGAVLLPRPLPLGALLAPAEPEVAG